MKSLGDTYFGRALALLAGVVTRYRWVFFWPQIILCILAGIYAWQHWHVDPSRDNLVGAGEKYHQIYMEYKKEFPAQEDVVAVIESADPVKNRQFVERLGARLDAEGSLFTNVVYRKDIRMLGRKALLFADEEDLEGLHKKLTEYLPFIQRFTQASNMNSLFNLVNQMFLHARREANQENDSLVNAIPMLRNIIEQATDCLQRPGTPPSPGVAALFGTGDEQMYVSYDSNRVYLVSAQPPSEPLKGRMVARFRELVAETEQEVAGINVGVTGSPVLEYDEMHQSQRDSMVASVVSFVVCALIFIYGYQETGRPLKATFCLLIGLVFTLAYTMGVVGHLNLLTVMFLPILIGLAIDFGVHLITRYEEELRLGQSEEAAIKKAMVYTGQGIFTGALTTAAAFFAMGLTRFKGIQEMGVICGGGMLICLVPMMTLLPVLLFRGRQNVIDKEMAQHPPLRARIENVWLRRPVKVVIVTAVLVALAATQLHRLYFDYDLRNMQSKGLPAVVFEKKLFNAATNALLFAVALADTPEDAIKLERDLTNLPTVSKVITMGGKVIGGQEEKLRQIGKIKEAIAGIHFAPVDTSPVELTVLSATLYSTAGFMGAAAGETATNRPALSDQLAAMRLSVLALRRQMLLGTASRHEMAAEKLATYQQALFNNVHETFQALQEQDNSAPLRESNFPPELRNRFIGKTGKHLLMVYPKHDIWQRTNQEAFVQDLRKVYKDITGVPVELYHYTAQLKESYEQAALYALIVIVGMVFIHFRTVSSVILALLPVAIGFAWLCGVMGWFGVPFNPANIMVLPLVIGIGVTNGIQILNRFAEERTPSILAKSTGKAVFVSGLTTISGFGSLVLAKHQGIRSLGEVMSIGLATCMVAALTFLPALLTMWNPWGGPPKKQPSGDNAQSTLGREEPR